MGQIKHKINGDAKALAGNTETPGGTRYTGKVPPKDVYKGKLKFFGVRMKNGKIQENRNGDYMLRGAVEIDEVGPKKKYNGYLINFNQNVSDQGVPWINQMLDAMSNGSEKYRQDFWDRFVAIDEKGRITKIGRTRYADGSVPVIVSARDDTDVNGARTLAVGSWLMSSAVDESDDEDEDEDDALDTDEVEDADEEDEDSDESLLDDEEDDADEESEDEDEDEDDSEDDDEEEEDEEDEEPEEDDEEPALVAELKGLDRKALIARAKQHGIKALKSKTEDDYRNEIFAAESKDDDEPPF